MALKTLTEGYKRFHANRTGQEADHYRTLGREGQTPKALVIGCSDSRVEPAHIFDCSPGDIFTVRNVANLVPPPEPDKHHHGTSAAIEFAVESLSVPVVMVLGHSGCGGIAAYVSSRHGTPAGGDYLAPWLDLLERPYDDVEDTSKTQETIAATLEKRAILQSLEHLKNFPFVARKVASGELALAGAYFEIEETRLSLATAPDYRFKSLIN